MGLNLKNKKTYYFVDNNKLMLRQNYSWENANNFGEKDCIGRTLMAYVAYKYAGFAYGVKSCYSLKVENNGKTYLEGYRHPDFFNSYNDMSRDHILNTFVLLRLCKDNFLYYLARNLKWKISKRYKFTLDLWLWMKGIAGNKITMFLYYLFEIPTLFLNITWNKILWKIGGFKPEPKQDDYIKVLNKNISKRKYKICKLMFPYYTLLQIGFMVYSSNNNLGDKIIKKIGLWGTPNENILMKLLFDGKVTKKEVYSYKPMTGDRWSTVLNEINDRDVHLITDPELIKENVIDVDVIKKLYNEKYK